MKALFRDRRHAGVELARALTRVVGAANAHGGRVGDAPPVHADEEPERFDLGVVVVALPRGGVPVAFEVARSLGASLDVLVVRKLGAPGHPELAVGAIASGGARVLNDDIGRALRLDEMTLRRIAESEERELRRREELYRGEGQGLDVTDRTVVLVDDGVATGATMLVAVSALRQLQASRVIVAVPVGATDSLARLRTAADEVVCLHQPRDLVSVGQWYEDFSQTTDAEVRELLTGQDS